MFNQLYQKKNLIIKLAVIKDYESVFNTWKILLFAVVLNPILSNLLNVIKDDEYHFCFSHDF